MAVAWLDAGLREKIEFQVLKYLQHFEHILVKEQCSEAGLDCLEAELADVNVNNHAHGNVLLSNGHTFLHYYHMQTRTSEDWGPSHDKASCVRARGEQKDRLRVQVTTRADRSVSVSAATRARMSTPSERRACWSMSLCGRLF